MIWARQEGQRCTSAKMPRNSVSAAFGPSPAHERSSFWGSSAMSRLQRGQIGSLADMFGSFPVFSDLSMLSLGCRGERRVSARSLVSGLRGRLAGISREEGLEQCPQGQTRAVKPDLYRHRCERQNARRLLRRELFDVAQDEHRSVGQGKPLDRGSNLRARLTLEDDVGWRRMPGSDGRSMPALIIEPRKQLFDRQF